MPPKSKVNELLESLTSKKSLKTKGGESILKSPIRKEQKSPSPKQRRNIRQDEDLELNLSPPSPSPSPITKVNIKSSPSSTFEDLSTLTKKRPISEVLKEYRYSLLNYIVDTDDNLLYLCTYDPAGRVIFVENDTKDTDVCETAKSIYIKKGECDIEQTWRQSMLTRMTSEFYGCALFNGGGLVVLKRNDAGDIETFSYSCNCDLEDKNDIPRIYVVIKMSEIKAKPLEIIEHTKGMYEVIQKYQIYINKDVMNTLIESTNSLRDSLIDLDKSFTGLMQTIIQDSISFNDMFIRFYEMYGDRELDEEDKVKFDKVSLNLLFRFNEFNQISENLSSLRETSKDILECKNKIDLKTYRFNEGIKKLEKKVIEKEDFDIQI